MPAIDSHKLLSSIVHGATTLGIGEAFTISATSVYLAVRAGGKIGKTSRGLVERDIVASARWIGGTGSPIADSAAKASLVCNVFEMDGTTAGTVTATNMKAATFEYGMDRDSPPGRITQQFVVEDDLDAINVTFA